MWNFKAPAHCKVTLPLWELWRWTDWGLEISSLQRCSSVNITSHIHQPKQDICNVARKPRVSWVLTITLDEAFWRYLCMYVCVNVYVCPCICVSIYVYAYNFVYVVVYGRTTYSAVPILIVNYCVPFEIDNKVNK